MDNLSTEEGLKELWKSYVPQDNGQLKNIQINFGLESGDISVQSEAIGNNGKPLYEWNINTNTGLIEEITRPSD